jgi:hypothetical protein
VEGFGGKGRIGKIVFSEEEALFFIVHLLIDFQTLLTHSIIGKQIGPHFGTSFFCSITLEV